MKTKWYEYPLRLVVLPFVVAIITVHLITILVVSIYNFLSKGGELIVYWNNRTTIKDVYHKLENLLNELDEK